MPVPKRYFHCSQELNGDPELWQFTSKFGDRSLRTWLQILVYLDKSGNQWRTSGDWLATLSRMVRQSVANVSRQIRWLTENKWLVIRETTADGLPLVLEAPNWAKYNRTAEHKRVSSNPDTGTQKGLIDTPSFPTPTPTPSLTNPKTKKEIAGLASPAPACVGTRKVQLSDDAFIEALRENVAYKGINIDVELGKIDAWLISPKGAGKQKTRNRILTWLNKVADEQRGLTHSPITQSSTCTEKIPSANGRTQTACGKQIASEQNPPVRPFCVAHLRGRQLIAAHLQNGHMV